MVRWHETLAAQLGLRMGGAAFLTAAWFAGHLLYERVHGHPSSQATLTDLGLCALVFVLAVIGNALLFVGPGLWKQVEIPGRWSAALIEPRQFEVFPFRTRG